MRALLALSLLLLGSCKAEAPEVEGYVYKVRIAYLADLPANYETRRDCEIQKAMIEHLKDTPAIRDGLTRFVICTPVGKL